MRETQYTAGLGQAFEPRCDVDPVAVDVVLVDDDVAEIDADAEPYATRLQNIRVAHPHLALDLDRAAHRVDDAGEFDEQPVAGRLNDATAMFGDLGIGYFASQRCECRAGALLVLSHQPRVASDIGRAGSPPAAARPDLAARNS